MSLSAVSQSTFSSALRFGLSSVEPVEEVYEKKIGRFKLIHKITRLVPKQKYSYRDYTAIFLEDVLQGMTIIPKFDPEAVHKMMMQKSLEAVEKLGLKERIDRLEELRESTSLSDYAEAHDILIDIAKELSTSMSREDESRYFVKKFFGSNFALSYFSDLMRGSQTYNKFLNLMEYELRLMRGYVRAAMQRSIDYAMKIHKARRVELRPMVNASDAYRTASMTLKTYVEICNSEKVEDLFEQKMLDKNKLDEQEFKRLFSNYLIKLDYLRDKLFERKPELFTSKVDFTLPINNMWKNMATLTISS